MDVEQLFDASYQRVLSDSAGGQDFFDAFYRRFIASSDEVAAKFRHTDMARQQAMLKKAFYRLLSFFASSETDYYLERIAVVHDRRHLDIRPALYDLWLESLIDTVRAFDPCFDADVELAWRLVMAPGIVFMTFHHGRGPTTPGA
ncbi:MULTISPECIES: globin [Modicisalibacter]|uniref:globin n=1 Tax=Modicisalibacter TaxID=574347 RepID=UPI00100C15E6|nr:MULTISPECIES: globin [Halomonadaceae]MBZ9557457.1 globin [Modicisalibacter sp. R2A 31.J]MBZ9573877.1 globin [Modicisalibacter sp. MOD 31.J]